MRKLFPLLLLAAACGRDEPAPSKKPVQQREEPHTHDPVYGGTLVELDHAVSQVEIVHDPATGTVTAYIWDGHVHGPRRIEQKSILVDVLVAGESIVVELLPVADAATGEKAGDTSRFEGRSDLLKGLTTFEAELGRMTVAGYEFGPRRFTYRSRTDD